MSEATCHESRPCRSVAATLPFERERDLTVNNPKLLAYLLLAWIVAEIVAFALVVQSVGVMLAIALALGTTAIGLADVKRLFTFWKNKPKGKGAAGANVLEASLHALGSFLLILPGFATDLLGLALKSPSIRASLAQKIRDRDKRKGPQTIDLQPNEWQQLEKPKRKRKSAVAKVEPAEAGKGAD